MTDNKFELSVPRNIEAEMSCLGTMMQHQESIFKVQQRLTVDDFYSKENRVICQAIFDLAINNKVADLSTVSFYIRDHNLLDKIGGTEYLSCLLEASPTDANIDYYIEMILDKSKRRKLIESSRLAIIEAQDESNELNDVLGKSEKEIFNIANKSVSSGFEHCSEIVVSAMQKIFDRHKAGRNITGFSTGFKKLDEKLDGFHEKQYYLIGARASMGKTAFSMNIAENIADIENVGVAVFSLEMPKERIIIRMLSTMTHIDSNRIFKGSLSKEEWDRIMSVSEKIKNRQLFVDDDSNLTIFDIKAKLMSLMSKHDIKVVVIDYLQLMHHPEYKENRQQQVAAISAGLKALSKDMNLCIIALSQLNRSKENKNDKVPQISDLRESGAQEQDADVVLLIHREEYYDKEETKEEKKGKADIIIGKNRNGPIDTFEVEFHAEFTEFRDIDYGQVNHNTQPKNYTEPEGDE